MAEEVPVRACEVRVACAGRATAHILLPEHADHAALKAAAAAALGEPYDLRLAAPRASGEDDPWAPLWEGEDWSQVEQVQSMDDGAGWSMVRTSFDKFADARYARDASAVLALIEADLIGTDARAAADASDRCWEFAHCARNFGAIKASASLAEAVTARLAQFWRRRWDHGEDRALERCCVAAWKLAEAGADAALVDACILEPFGEMLAHFGETLDVTDAPPPDEGLWQACLGCLRDLAGVSVLARALLGRNATALDSLAARFALGAAPSAAQLRLAQTSMDCLWAGVGAAYGGAADDRRHYAEHGALSSLARLVAATTQGAPFIAIYGVACVCKLAGDARAGARAYLAGTDAALAAAAAFGAAVLAAGPMLTARERERAVTFAARGVRALARLRPPADRRVARAAAALAGGGSVAGDAAAGAAAAWLHAITRGAAEGLRPEVVANAACCCFEALGALFARGGAGRHAARVLGDALAVLRDCEAARRSHGLQVAVACAELVRACCAAEATVAVAMATGLFREICALAADGTPRAAPRPARARLAAALMALAGAAPVREESAATAALRRFRQKRAAARAFAGDVHIRALLDELAGGADEQAREQRQRVQAARAGLHRALAEDAGCAAADADNTELNEAARLDGAAGWDPPRAHLLAHALCAALAANPAGAGPEAAVASRLLVALTILVRRVDDAAARAPQAAERVVAALVDDVGTLDALCCAVVASSRALARGDAHHTEALVCEASAATLEVLVRHAPLRVLACGAVTQAFASIAERCVHPGMRAAQRSLLDLLWFGVACAPSVAEKHSLVDALPPTCEAMAALERLALDEEAEADDALKKQAANLLYWLAYNSGKHLAACPGIGEKRSRAPSGLVELCARALIAGRDAAAPVALHVLAKATAADARGARIVADRRAACAERCGPSLAAMVLGQRGEHLRGPAADLLLNVSAERRACRRVASCALDPLLALAEDPEVDPECASHTDMLLANLGRDAETRNLIHVRRLQLDNARADRVGSVSAPEASLASTTLKVKAGSVSASLASLPFAKRVAADATSFVGSAQQPGAPGTRAGPVARDRAARDPPRTLRGRLRDERVDRHLAARSPHASLAGPLDEARVGPSLAESSAARGAARRAGFAEGRADPTTWSPGTERLGRGAVGEKSVVLAPTSGARLSFSFPGVARAHHKPTSRLFAFKSVRGSTIRDMFPTYKFPSSRAGGSDDEYDENASDWHLCHEDRYRPPVVDPGPWPAVAKAPRWAPERDPVPPLDAVGAPEPPAVDGDARLTDCVAAPTCRQHYLPSFTSREVDYDRAWRGWGELDDFALLIRATIVAKPKITKAVATIAKVAWTLEASIFAPRRREADCRGFWHSTKFMKRLLGGDWTRLSALPRFGNLMKRLGGAAAEQALRGGLEKMYRTLLSAFDYYCIVTELDPMDMAMGSWLEFCTDLDLRGEAPGQVADQTLQGIFVQVNVEVGQARELALANDNNSLMRLSVRKSNRTGAVDWRRFEFIEAVVRLLGAAYGLEKKVRPAGDDGAAAAARAAEDFSARLAALPAAARDDPDDYRRGRLYAEACCYAFSRHKQFWQEMHRIMSAIAMDAGRPAFNMDRWLEFTELTGMRTSETTLTEAVKAYVVSRTRFLDDTVFKFELLDFVSFLEAIARLVEMTPVPSNAALAELGVDQVSEFYERVAALKEAVDGNEDRQRLSRLLAEDADQALSDKLELMLPYMLQNLTISTNGAYRTKNTQLPVNFLSVDQRERWTQQSQIERPAL